MDNEKISRSAGILMAVSSLPSPYGIGTMGKAAYDFVDFVKNTNHKYWQVLPLGPTSYGDSPYQSYSAYAGNPYLIDLDMLVEDGLLLKSTILSIDWGDGLIPIQISEEEAINNRFGQGYDVNLGHPNYVSYEKMYNNRFGILRQAFKAFTEKNNSENMNKEYSEFCEQNSFWLEDYSLFMACKNYYDNRFWGDWDEDIKHRTREGMEKHKVILEKDIEFWKFVQYEFFKQWFKLKAYANEKNIEIIGDIPIYMALDSADVWSHPDDFMLDENLTPTKVAGVPPDDFTELGQKWGNPLYDWAKQELDDYSWWRHRMEASAKLYDVIRIDHFIGIVKYYTIPADAEDARIGEYMQGPGMKLCKAINESIGNKKIIAEDLGVAIPEVVKLLEDNGYPGMKVIEFAFGGDRKNPHLPYNYTQNMVCYGGTHDNETLLGFFNQRNDWELGYAFDYLGTRDRYQCVDKVFRAAYSSVANLVIFQVQDILKLDNSARMNFPSTMGNWKWRMSAGALNQSHIDSMRYLASVFGRENV